MYVRGKVSLAGGLISSAVGWCKEASYHRDSYVWALKN